MNKSKEEELNVGMICECRLPSKSSGENYVSKGEDPNILLPVL